MRWTPDTMNSHRPEAQPTAQDDAEEKTRRLSEEAFTLAFYGSVAIAGLLSLVGTFAYGYVLLVDLF